MPFCRLHAAALVRAYAAPHCRRSRAHSGDLPVELRRLRALRVAPPGPAARGRGPREPSRREVGAPPQGPRPHLLHGEPQGEQATPGLIVFRHAILCMINGNHSRRRRIVCSSF